MANRYQYDLSHLSFVAGDIGRLQTVSLLPVVAGDSLRINWESVVRLSSLRRNLTLDAQVDTFIFFVPHRHVYGSDWTDLINGGTDSGVTLTAGASYSGQGYLGTKLSGTGTAPLWLTAGYNRIWNRYFRHPTDTAAIKTDSAILPGGVDRGGQYGELCGRLKKPWTTGITDTINAADKEVASVTVLDVTALAQQQGRYESEVERDYFGQYYTDILNRQWGGGANADADERPYLIMHNESSLSGYDVDGTDDASLGSYSGKSAGIVRTQAPKRFFGEHGMLWFMKLVRFPNIWHAEKDFLMMKSQPTYAQIAADPDMWMNEPPIPALVSDFFDGGAATDVGQIPYGQWYRYKADYVNTKYAGLGGFPFITGTPASAAAARYHSTAEYSTVFATEALAQWSSSNSIGVDALRAVPPAGSSIFAGTNKGNKVS